MANSPEKLLPAPFLFRFAVPCHHKAKLEPKDSTALGEKYALPSFAELDDSPEVTSTRFADVRAAWNETGVALSVRVEGKRQPPWCRESRLEDSDGLVVWIDTRNTHNVHRASRFCHQFYFMPTGAGRSLNDPFAAQRHIARAKEPSRFADDEALSVRSERRVDGYVMQAFISAAALQGWDPAEHPKLGFMYAVVDREMGEQTFSVGNEFPYQSDPSLWGTLELVK